MEFISQPNLPQKKVKLMIVDGRIDKDIEISLLNIGIELVKTMNLKAVYKAVSFHPDIMLHHIADKKIVYAPGLEFEFLIKLKSYGFELIEGSTRLKPEYPDNIAYNVARVGDKAFHNLKYTDLVLKNELEKMGVKFIHVNQGYTKCSVAIINSKCIITSDIGISNAAVKNGIEVLLLDPMEEILLPGLSHGFFGGCTGLIDKNTICITGDIQKLKAFDKIESFLISHGINIVSLSNNQVIDLGSLLPIGT